MAVLRGTSGVLGPQYPTDIPPRSYFALKYVFLRAVLTTLEYQNRIGPGRRGGGPDTLEGLYMYVASSLN